jgi:hypothetical protein
MQYRSAHEHHVSNPFFGKTLAQLLGPFIVFELLFLGYLIHKVKYEGLGLGCHDSNSS